MEFSNVTATAKANIYFDGKVVSHAITTAEGEKKTMGVIFPGSYHFGTEAAERMDIIDGSCTITHDSTRETSQIDTGKYFNVPANSGFTIAVAEGTTAQYVCSYID